jgi:hypothetical protein
MNKELSEQSQYLETVVQISDKLSDGGIDLCLLWPLTQSARLVSAQ